MFDHSESLIKQDPQEDNSKCAMFSQQQLEVDMQSRSITKPIGQATFDDLKIDCVHDKNEDITLHDLQAHIPFASEQENPKAAAPGDIGDIYPEVTWRWVIPEDCASATISLEPPHRFYAVNAAFEALTLFRRDELLGSSFRLLCGPGTNLKALNSVFRRISRGDFSSHSRGPVAIYRKDGDDVACTLRAFAAPPPAGLAHCIVAMQPSETAASCATRPPHRSTSTPIHSAPPFVPGIAAAVAAAAAAAAAFATAAASDPRPDGCRAHAHAHPLLAGAPPDRQFDALRRRCYDYFSSLGRPPPPDFQRACLDHYGGHPDAGEEVRDFVAARI